MVNKMNGWQRIGILTSLGWVIFVVTVAAINYSNSRDFGKATRSYCPTLYHEFFVWYDEKTNTEISIYKQGEKTDCAVASERAKKLRTQFLNGEISPKLKLKYDFPLFLTIVTIAPIILFWVSIYIFVWVVKWVAAGFRGNN